jgi:hypothetical protein
MMRPPRGDCAFITRNACWMHRNMPVRLMSTTFFHCSRSGPPAARRRIDAGIVEQQSTRPKACHAGRTARAPPPGWHVGGHGHRARPAPTFLCHGCSGSARRPASTTCQPSSSRASAAALPMPVPAPVTIAIFGFRNGYLLRCCGWNCRRPRFAALALGSTPRRPTALQPPGWAAAPIAAVRARGLREALGIACAWPTAWPCVHLLAPRRRVCASPALVLHARASSSSPSRTSRKSMRGRPDRHG